MPDLHRMFYNKGSKKIVLLNREKVVNKFLNIVVVYEPRFFIETMVPP